MSGRRGGAAPTGCAQLRREQAEEGVSSRSPKRRGGCRFHRAAASQVDGRVGRSVRVGRRQIAAARRLGGRTRALSGGAASSGGSAAGGHGSASRRPPLAATRPFAAAHPLARVGMVRDVGGMPIADRLLIGARSARTQGRRRRAAADRKDASISDAIVAACEQAPAARRRARLAFLL